MRIIKHLLFISLIVISAGIAAQEQPTRIVTDDQVNEIAKKLYCPVCEQITLDTCGTAACADWRYEIRLQLEAGLTEQQIIEDFVRRFGDRVVGTPLDPLLRGLSLITPWLLIALSLIGVAVVLGRKPSPEPNFQPTDNTNHYHEQFEQDIAGS